MERRDCERVRSESGRQGGATAVSRPVLGWDWARPWHWDHSGEPLCGTIQKAQREGSEAAVSHLLTFPFFIPWFLRPVGFDC